MDGRDIDSRKHELRCSMRAVPAALAPVDRTAAACLLAERLLDLPELQDARVVLGYSALPDEIDPSLALDALRARGTRIAYPRVEGAEDLGLYAPDTPDELVSGAFGILEPGPGAARIDPAAVEAAIVPGVAFDASGARLGRGKGYYDRLLALLGPSAIIIGVAFEGQLTADIPCAAHDARVHAVVTPERTIRCEIARRKRS